MGKFNLSEAAKEILSGNVAKKKSGQESGVGNTSLHGDVAYGTKEVDVGHTPTKTTDANPDYTKGTPTATAPGATPPVGSEPMKKLAKQPQEEGDVEQPEGKKATQKMAKNPGATFQSYGEETESDEEVVAEEKEEGHEDEAEDKKLIKKMMKKEKMKEEIESDVDALLSGENLSEEFKQKATTIFESAVVARTASLMEEVEEVLYEEFELAVEEVKEELAQKLDDYISYMAEEWVKDNQLAIEKGLRAEIVEDFIGGLKNLFIEHYIDIPEEKVDVVEELTTKIEDLESQVNEQIQSNADLFKQLKEHKKNEAIHAVCEGLTQTQVEKMKQLAESVDFTTDEEFADKLVTLRTSYFAQPVKTADSSALNEEVEIEDEKKPVVSNDPTIAAIASALSKTAVK